MKTFHISKWQSRKYLFKKKKKKKKLIQKVKYFSCVGRKLISLNLLGQLFVFIMIDIFFS